jgi:AGZA family xanthine/uracil permease-like MFS transporter
MPAACFMAPAVPVKIGNLHDPQVLLAIGGFVLMAVLMIRKIRGALLIGIVLTAVIGGHCSVLAMRPRR